MYYISVKLGDFYLRGTLVQADSGDMRALGGGLKPREGNGQDFVPVATFLRHIYCILGNPSRHCTRLVGAEWMKWMNRALESDDFQLGPECRLRHWMRRRYWLRWQNWPDCCCRLIRSNERSKYGILDVEKCHEGGKGFAQNGLTEPDMRTEFWFLRVNSRSVTRFVGTPAYSFFRDCFKNIWN